jgi:hypothetical protein
LGFAVKPPATWVQLVAELSSADRECRSEARQSIGWSSSMAA